MSALEIIFLVWAIIATVFVFIYYGACLNLAKSVRRQRQASFRSTLAGIVLGGCLAFFVQRAIRKK